MRERHPDWTPAQIRAALIGSAVPAYADSNATVEASPLRTGGGFVDAAGAVAPGVLSDPPMLGFGLLRPGASVTVPVSVSDAGDGAGVWQVAIDRHGGSPAGADATAPSRADGPARRRGAAAGHADDRRRLAARATRRATCVLTQGTRTRRIPYWAHVERPRLAAATARLLRHPGDRARLDARAARPRRSATATRPTPARSGCPCAGGAARRSTASTSPGARSTSGVTVEPLAGGGLRPFLMRGAGREPRRRRVRPADRRRPVADRRSGAVGRPLLGAAGRLRGRRSTRRGAAAARSGCASGSTTSRRRRSGGCASPATRGRCASR